jgi:hypothetical protein
MAACATTSSSIYLVLPADTIEYIRNEVCSDTDLTSLPVDVAFMPQGETPTALDWIAATWEPGNIVRWLYPGDQPPGIYEYWIRITATPEVPIRDTGIVILIS